MATFTFGLNQIGRNCGLLGQHAGVVVRDVSYWMGQNAFFVFDGTVKKLPCSVDDFVFENMEELDKSLKDEQIFSDYEDQFQWFLGFALFFIFLDLMFTQKTINFIKKMIK